MSDQANTETVPKEETVQTGEGVTEAPPVDTAAPVVEETPETDTAPAVEEIPETDEDGNFKLAIPEYDPEQVRVAVTDVKEKLTKIISWTSSFVTEGIVNPGLDQIVTFFNTANTNPEAFLDLLKETVDRDTLPVAHNALNTLVNAIGQHQVFVLGAAAADHKHFHMIALMEETRRHLDPIIDCFNNRVMMQQQEEDLKAAEAANAEGQVSDTSE